MRAPLALALAVAGALGLAGCTPPTPTSDPSVSPDATAPVGELVTVKGATQPTVCGVKLGIIGIDETSVRLGWEPNESASYAIGDEFSPRPGCTVRVVSLSPSPADSDEEGAAGTVDLDVVTS